MRWQIRLFIFLFISGLFHNPSVWGQSKQLYKVSKSIVRFRSNAPKELITASSDQLRGIVDFEKGTFVFKIKLNSFEGFNNGLQKEHFNENYVESSLYPEAIFSGKIIESINLNKKQSVQIRCKGDLNLHGLHKQCIISVTMKISDRKIEIHSDFVIYLQDYNIKVPRVVYNKLASEISINLDAQLDVL